MGSVVGVGVDRVEVDRIARALVRSPAFVQRCFTEGERRDAGEGPGRVQRLAARFAAKEAAFKALDLRGGLHRWREVEVVRRPQGQPTLVFRGRAEERFTSLGARNAYLSFSHDRQAAVAVVVVES